jgi:hypothetical protein
MERQVETINILVTSYMKIVAKMTRDFIPKTITYNIVQELRKYVSRELLANLYAVPDPKSLLQESFEERQRREAKIAEFEAVKSALSIIENFHLNARKVAADVMSTSTVTAHFQNATTNNHFEQSSNHSTSLFENSFGAGANHFSNPHLQRNQSTRNSFATREPPSSALPPNLMSSTYRNSSATPPIPPRPIPSVSPRN